MGVHNENKSTARKAITSLINLLKAESDIIGKDNSIPSSKIDELIKTVNELHRELNVYSYLETNPEEMTMPEEQEAIVIPAPPAYIPAVQFEKIPVEIPLIKEPQPSKEIPTIFPGKNYPDIKSFIGFNEKLMFLRLFDSKIDDYEKALAQINSCSTREEANTIIDVLSSIHQWKNDSEPVQIFLSTVKRRFS